jgi:HlyD family secretion protein
MTARRIRWLAAALLGPLALSSCTLGAGTPAMQGYVEGTYTNVAPEDAGRLASVAVRRGQQVKAGDLLFKLTDSEQTAAVAEAKARVAQAEAQVTQARSTLTAAEKDFSRAADLLATHVVAQAQVDAARAQRDSAAAQVSAAERNLTAVNATLSTAELKLARRTVNAPAGGSIEDVFYETGEYVGAAQPVVSLLAPEGRKIRFYVPEPQLSAIRVGDQVALACDGCAAGLRAEVSFIAAQAEYTPPLIYSKENRAKLVFRVEAKPLGDAVRLNVGQPVDVRPQP